jgi:hypothetical protein
VRQGAGCISDASLPGRPLHLLAFLSNCVVSAFPDLFFFFLQLNLEILFYFKKISNSQERVIFAVGSQF